MHSVVLCGFSVALCVTFSLDYSYFKVGWYISDWHKLLFHHTLLFLQVISRVFHEIINGFHEIGFDFHEIGFDFHEIGFDFHEIDPVFHKTGTVYHEFAPVFHYTYIVFH